MSKGKHLGEFERLILLAISRLGDDAYGMTIRRLIHENTERDVSIGSVYATLERLERKSFVRSRVGEETEVRGGRAKRYFEITAPGEHALQDSDKAYMKMRAAVGTLLVWEHR